mmetsp:Transcript_13570/g.29986  ORF Transcript_13570/g.29986 Transcript_13570/m.29986 type:complete len:275 (-) Transcript_13570:1698-2522(-)
MQELLKSGSSFHDDWSAKFAKKPHLLPGPRGKPEVLLCMFLVVHSASPINIFSFISIACSIVFQDLLIMALGSRIRALALALLFMILLHCSDSLFYLRIAVINQLRQQLQELVVAVALDELIQDLSVALRLKSQVEEVHDRNAELVLVSVGEVIVAHDRLFHGDENIYQARDQLLVQRWMVQFVPPRSESKTKAVQKFHGPSTQRWITDMIFRGHDNAQRCEDRVGIHMDKESGRNPTSSLLSLPVPVEIAELQNILQNRARHHVPTWTRCRWW